MIDQAVLDAIIPQAYHDRFARDPSLPPQTRDALIRERKNACRTIACFDLDSNTAYRDELPDNPLKFTALGYTGEPFHPLNIAFVKEALYILSTTVRTRDPSALREAFWQLLYGQDIITDVIPSSGAGYPRYTQALLSDALSQQQKGPLIDCMQMLKSLRHIYQCPEADRGVTASEISRGQQATASADKKEASLSLPEEAGDTLLSLLRHIQALLQAHITPGAEVISTTTYDTVIAPYVAVIRQVIVYLKKHKLDVVAEPLQRVYSNTDHEGYTSCFELNARSLHAALQSHEHALNQPISVIHSLENTQYAIVQDSALPMPKYDFEWLINFIQSQRNPIRCLYEHVYLHLREQDRIHFIRYVQPNHPALLDVSSCAKPDIETFRALACLFTHTSQHEKLSQLLTAFIAWLDKQQTLPSNIHTLLFRFDYTEQSMQSLLAVYQQKGRFDTFEAQLVFLKHLNPQGRQIAITLMTNMSTLQRIPIIEMLKWYYEDQILQEVANEYYADELKDALKNKGLSALIDEQRNHTITGMDLLNLFKSNLLVAFEQLEIQACDLIKAPKDVLEAIQLLNFGAHPSNYQTQTLAQLFLHLERIEIQPYNLRTCLSELDSDENRKKFLLSMRNSILKTITEVGILFSRVSDISRLLKNDEAFLQSLFYEWFHDHRCVFEMTRTPTVIAEKINTMKELDNHVLTWFIYTVAPALIRRYAHNPFGLFELVYLVQDNDLQFEIINQCAALFETEQMLGTKQLLTDLQEDHNTDQSTLFKAVLAELGKPSLPTAYKKWLVKRVALRMANCIQSSEDLIAILNVTTPDEAKCLLDKLDPMLYLKTQAVFDRMPALHKPYMEAGLHDHIQHCTRQINKKYRPPHYGSELFTKGYYRFCSTFNFAAVNQTELHTWFDLIEADPAVKAIHEKDSDENIEQAFDTNLIAHIKRTQQIFKCLRQEQWFSFMRNRDACAFFERIAHKVPLDSSDIINWNRLLRADPLLYEADLLAKEVNSDDQLQATYRAAFTYNPFGLSHRSDTGSLVFFSDKLNLAGMTAKTPAAPGTRLYRVKAALGL